MPYLSHQLRRAAPAALLIVLGAGLSCRDALTPAAPPGTPQPRAVSRGVQSSATFTLGTTPTSFVASATLNSFAKPTAVRITVAGIIQATNLGTAPNSDRSFGPFGWQQCGYGMMKVSYSGGGGWHELAQCSPTSHLVTSSSVERVVSGQGTVTRNDPWSAPCYDQQQSVCWAYSGSQTVTVEVLDFDIKVVASPKAISQATNVWVSLATTTTAPQGTPIKVLKWHFKAKYGAQEFDYQDFEKDWWKWIPQTGTISVLADVNGVLKTAETEVYVVPSELGLKVDPTVVDSARGDTVTAHARVVPDSVDGAPSPATLQIVEWKWQPDVGVSSAPCPASANPCVFVTAQSGTLTLRAKVNGVEKTKTQRIRAIPCKTGWPLLDDLGVRDSMHSSIDQALTNNIEQKVYMYRRPDGSYAVFTAQVTYADNCIVDGAPPISSSDSLVLVAVGHTHQYRVGDIVQCPRPANAAPTRYGPPAGHNANDFRRLFECDPNNPRTCVDVGLESGD
jgi:hypothetical protein